MMEKEQPHISSHMPHHMIEHILSRLPAKSLLRFMAVCKLWRSTICDLNFTELHRRHSQNRIGGGYFAFVGYWEDKAIVMFNNHGGYEVPPPIELKLCPSINNYYRVSPILNGLVCLYSDQKDPHSLIMNISTREILPLPKTRYRGTHVRSTHAIGFDPATNKYKVLHYVNWYFRDWKPISEVFTLGTTSWRCCANTPYLIMEFSKTSRCLNGRIYWIASKGDDTSLISFDVSREVYHTAKFSLPLDHLSDLFTLGGDLAAVRFCEERQGIEILKIEQFNNELKVVGKRKIAIPSSFTFIGELLVLGVGPNGEIILRDDCNVDRTYYLDLDDPEASKVEFDGRKMSPFATYYYAENMLRLSDPSLASRRE